MTWTLRIIWHCCLQQGRQQFQAKTDILAEKSAQIGLHVNKGKDKVMWVNTQSQEPISEYGEPLDEVPVITFLSTLEKLGGTDADINARKGKARSSFKKMKNV